MTQPIESIVSRGSIVESVHHTTAALVAPDGSLAFSAGDVDQRYPARSSIKAFQAAALMLSGAYEKYHLSDRSLALSCASHSGEPYHIEGVTSFMQEVGVTESDLLCGHHLPYNDAASEALLRDGEELNQLTNNCSGKHTGFLAVAKALDADLPTYLDPAGPVQQMIFEQLSVWLGRDDLALATDGCSAPTAAISMVELAELGQRLVSGSDPLLQHQLRAVQAYPQMVGGTDRFDTLFMQTLQGRSLSKEGAEGIQMLAIVDNSGESWGLALKVHDGSGRPREQVALRILDRHNLVTVDESRDLEKAINRIYANHRGQQVATMTTTLPPL